MDQISSEWRHMIEDIGEGKARPEASDQLPSSISLIPLLETAHHVFAQAFRINVPLMLWPEAWFPGDDRQCPMWLRPWIQFPQQQEETWNRILHASQLVTASIFPPQIALEHTAQTLQWYPVHSEDTLKQFAHRTLDDYLGTVVNFLEHEDTLRYRFSIRGQLKFDRPRECCVSVAKFGFEEPAYAVLYMPSFSLTVPELVAGLHATAPLDSFDEEPTTFEEHATAIVVHAIVRIYSRMMGSGRRYGYIYTGEALVFLHIPLHDCTIVEYYLCVPARDVDFHGYDPHSNWVRRTALGQVLAFALQSLAATPPSQEWQDAVYQSYRPLEDDYSIIMPQAPDDIRLRPPPEFMYENSFWTRFWENLLQARIPTGHTEVPGLPTSGSSDFCNPYCTQECLLGTFEKGALDENCPNAAQHGVGRHQISSQEICDMMNEQLRANRYRGFEQLHIVGRTCYLLKASLLSHGYTMLIKATSASRSHKINTELNNYESLMSLQGSQIPVCLGMFSPKIPYWYHGVQMEYMLLLSWSGIRTDQHVTLETSQFLDQEMRKLQDKLQEHGAVQKDSAFRNLLWNPMSQSFVMVDLEDLKWLTRSAKSSEGHESQQAQFNTDEIQSSGYLGDAEK
ncbi:Major facilitator superfamily domain, general substrate transporter [Penicillium digitatum]|uniref:Uncharacterized protein n=3 Tax=Penicillium digitatum TaxID=36651 RepID=K9GWM4_PEND2|nr:hypothetical protein PDIP_31090 [Penicillium digitatum Pd1]EKV17431.1 hypothetical protein PDIG_15550 [Penicillium digitatum PHI26]EKV17594.1 hypothetical protein PDIP_31090 [Penicillium digitatum Pd1]QQK46805.1 Major facilitator superfamily domain, general substrate transporter [Penicillium digitatum]